MKNKGLADKRRAIDWSDIHGCLEKLQTNIESGFAPTPEEQKQILRARARALAKDPGAGGVTPSVEVLEFLLASERYGIESSRVREVYPLKELTPLPCTPSFVLGIINVRGQILSVIDIKKFFELPEKGLTDLNKVIVVRAEDMELGLLADVIVGMRSIALQEIQPLPTWAGIRAEYLRGVTPQRLTILDVERILSDPKIIVHEEVEI